MRQRSQRDHQKNHATVTSTKESVLASEKVAIQLEKVDEQSVQVGNNLAAIYSKLQHVDELVAGIASASSEQSHGIAQINAAMSRMDEITQSNAALAQEGASAAEELKQQSATMKDAISILHVVIEGSNTL